MFKLVSGIILSLVVVIGYQAQGSYIIPPNSVYPNAIQSGAVTQSKLAPRATSSPSPSPSVGAGGYVITTASSVSTSSAEIEIATPVVITTTGRPIVVGLMCDSGGTECSITSTSTSLGDIAFYRGTCEFSASRISRQQFVTAASPSSFFYIDLEPAGTYTYCATLQFNFGSGSVSATSVKLYAYEQ